MRLALVTLVTRNYLHYAHALGRSVKQHEPDLPLWVCIADDPGPDFQPAPEWDHWVLGKDLGIPQWRRFAFQYTPFELSCALKPFVMQHALDAGAEAVAFFDGDMQLHAPLVELRQWLAQQSIVLTPHAMRAQPDAAAAASDRGFLVSGAFNAGFLAARRSPAGEAFLAWWRGRLLRDCIEDTAGGMFVDQKWLDLVPGLFFPEVHISRHAGYNAGHWTLARVEAHEDAEGRLQLGGDPLVFFHYSGFAPSNPFLRGKGAQRLPRLQQMFAEYTELLDACGREKYSRQKCEFATLTDGTPIDPLWREAIRSDQPALAGIDDPFDVAKTPDLVRRFRALEEGMRKHRKVWRFARLEQRGASGKLKQFGKYVERMVRDLRDRRRAA